MRIRERDIEKKLNEGIRKIGGRTYKFTSPGNAGVPDRIVLLPAGKIIFVELKAEDGTLSGRQKLQIRKLQELGCEVWTLWGKADVEAFLVLVEGGEPNGVYPTRLPETGWVFHHQA